MKSAMTFIKPLLIILLFTLPSTAQDINQEISRSDRASHAIHIGGAAADFITTRLAINSGAHEAGIAGDHWTPELALISATTAGIELLSRQCSRAGYPAIASGFRYIFGGVHITASVWNAHVWRNQLARKPKLQPNGAFQ